MSFRKYGVNEHTCLSKKPPGMEVGCFINSYKLQSGNKPSIMNSIIHFTEQFETLSKILDDGALKLKYCREVFYLADRVSSSAVHPMVSFSEQAISSIDNKNITYGRFGIALKRKWVQEMKLHPVLYLDRDSHVAEALSDLLKARRKNAKKALSPNVRLSIITIKCFTKNAVGYNSFFKMKNFNFKEEKEWRYVPKKTDIGDSLISQTKSKYDKAPNFYNSKLDKYPLKFAKTDIQWVFVINEHQRHEVAEKFGLDKNIIKISAWTTDLQKAKVKKSS